ncbi:MAG TPA: sulfatase/phosphatase domain-containing protein, partial [Solirubrobacteraceae bacterium]|nr:sulfatase/phosphatase domain-containing protein [Solirubrobacteraceae bacterium]
QGVGAVLEVLEETALAESTLVFLTTDHGLAFPGAKATLYDRGLGVMLIMRGPGGFSGGKVIDAMVTHLDVYPTLCELAGVPRKPWLQGFSLLPLIEDSDAVLHEEIYAGATFHAAYEPQRAVRTTRWKYIRRFGDRDLPVLANCDDSPSKEVLLRHGWAERPVAREQLFDLVFDPNEAANLAADPAHRPVLDDLRARLARWMADTDDPLLRGDVQPPPGVELNDPGQRSAAEPTFVTS